MACNRPFLCKTKEGTSKAVPCGWCLQCRIDKREEWTMRLAFEVQAHQGYFLTLTYDDDHLPKDESLHLEDLQKFFKRYRKNSPDKIKYYAVGEYGEQGNLITGLRRPHYHAIVIGHNALKAQSIVPKAWNFGFIKCLPAQHASIRYVLKYMDKQIHGEELLAKEYGDKTPPFAVMSKSLGLEWIKNHPDVIDHFNGVPYNGRVLPIPRYYKNHYAPNDVGMSPDKKRVVLQYMSDHDCDWITALNALGSVNEQHLLGAERLKK